MGISAVPGLLRLLGLRTGYDRSASVGECCTARSGCAAGARQLQPILLERQGDQWVQVTGYSQSPAPAQPEPPKTVEATHLRAVMPSRNEAAEPPRELPPAVLVFRDGHEEEVKSYTIIGKHLVRESELLDQWLVDKKDRDCQPGCSRHPEAEPGTRFEIQPAVRTAGSDDPTVSFRFRKGSNDHGSRDYGLFRSPSPVSRIPSYPERFSYHFTLPVEEPMATMSLRPSPFMSAMATPEVAISASSSCRCQFTPEVSAA